ncbi:MerR family transcriptional regulator [Staphylococcus warneri]|uniref:MerR family transcriptional regulator n=4 Tax=Bacilli TaxID=91061 RepID=A0A8B2ZFH1_STAWA|nr:MerR family transcriptional regulator [Staphylococcus warneri]KKI60267.1 transcriptional regulator, MerR family [Staphylococcus warneri]MCK6088392.1 MerR family transcriptional regulator [Staphylococcus warneri]MCK6166820.1 MerR family transcriptional regulator [Staphylococcus warneri]MCK6176536.1 MerR family transcriptional regulator [Staphylococcus warneri]MCK6244577.1 MerR family transcriptional regulator [Staphylococcus warneri]
MEYQYSLKEIMKITGVTKRTLHYYDEIALLKVKKNGSNHRIYSQKDLVKLQKIILLKSMDMSIKDISKVINKSDSELKMVLKKQKEILNRKIESLENTKSAVEQYIKDVPITEINELNNIAFKEYQEEAKIKYGHTDIYKEFVISNGENLFKEEKMKEFEEIFQKFNKLSLNKIDVEDAYEVVYEWKEFMNQIGLMDNQLLCLIADTYQSDERFNNYFKKYENPYITEYISQSINYHLS